MGFFGCLWNPNMGFKVNLLISFRIGPDNGEMPAVVFMNLEDLQYGDFKCF